LAYALLNDLIAHEQKNNSRKRKTETTHIDILLIASALFAAGIVAYFFLTGYQASPATEWFIMP
jgi:uncharacterized membrane protein